MLKKLLIASSIFAVLLMVVLSFITAKYLDKEEILRVTNEREQLRTQRENLTMLVEQKDSVKKILEKRVVVLETEVNVKRAEVDSLEENREETQLSVRKLRTENDLENKLIEAFPEIKTSMKITAVPVPNHPDNKIHYFSVPFRYAETFLIDHQNSQNYKVQIVKLKEMDTLQQKIIGLEKKIVVVEEEKSNAFQAGYDSAYVNYEELNEKYLKLLNDPPSVEFGLPQIGAIAIGTAAGFVSGVAIGSASK